MVITVAKPHSLETFLELPETKPASEFINNKISQKPMPQGKHSRLQSKFSAYINQVVEELKIAYAFTELRCTFGGALNPINVFEATVGDWACEGGVFNAFFSF